MMLSFVMIENVFRPLEPKVLYNYCSLLPQNVYFNIIKLNENR